MWCHVSIEIKYVCSPSLPPSLPLSLSGLWYAVDFCQSLILTVAMMEDHLTVESVADLSRLEIRHQVLHTQQDHYNIHCPTIIVTCTMIERERGRERERERERVIVCVSGLLYDA